MTAGRERWAVRAALLLTLASVLMVGASLLIGADVPGPLRMPLWHPEIVVALTYTPVASLLLRHRPGLKVAWLMVGAGLSAALYVLSLNLAPWLILNHWPGGDFFLWLTYWLWSIDTYGLILVMPLIFPDGRLVSRWFRPVLVAALAVPVMICVHLTYEPDIRRFDNGVSSYPLQDVPLIISGTILATLVLGLVSVAIRFWHSPSDVRRQIIWIIYPGVITQMVVFTGEVTPIPDVIRNATVALVPLCVAIAITRYRLYDIDIVVNRTLVYAGLVAVITLVYFALVSAASLFVADQGQLAGLLGAIAAGAVFEPARRRLQRTVDRLMHGERDPYRLADLLNRRLQTASDPADALATAAQTVREALGASGVVIEVLDRGGRAARADDGDLGARPQVIPLIWAGEPVGRLLFSHSDPPDIRLASVLARNLATVANAVRLAADVQRSRERILSTREEERRRLRRDLHDGLGPTLASLAMTVDAARITLPKDPSAVDPLLEALRATMGRAIGDIRDLVYGLRPPAIDDLGLLGAITGLADNVTEIAGPRIDVEVDGELDDLPAAVEVAAYRIIQEAITNIRRHAGADVVVVRLERGTALQVSITDDGVGVSRRSRAGVGLSSMRERAAELGGSCQIGPGPEGGTRVLARLPINVAVG